MSGRLNVDSKKYSFLDLPLSEIPLKKTNLVNKGNTFK